MASEIDSDDDNSLGVGENLHTPDGASANVATLETFEDEVEVGEDPDLAGLNATRNDKYRAVRNLEIRRAIEARNEQRKLEEDLNYLELDRDLDDDGAC